MGFGPVKGSIWCKVGVTNMEVVVCLGDTNYGNANFIQNDLDNDELEIICPLQ